MRARWILLAALLPLVACGGPRPRFVPGPVLWEVDDRADIEAPAENEFVRLAHHTDNFLPRQLRLGLDPVSAGPARDVNRLGEVPSSSWYRAGAMPTAAQVAKGAGGDDPGPEAFFPWTITSLKVGGRNPGFVIRDARGAGYIVKFDKPGVPIVSTAAGAVAARLFWALGYHVPDDRVVYFRRDQLTIAPDATRRNEMGHKHPIEVEQVDRLLARVAHRNDRGEYRALVSRYLDGRPIGGYRYRGTREDDPNDLIPHQDRRSLRALRVFGAWLQHVDLKIDNTLDVYVEEDGRRFVRHYLVDFDGCLGGYWAARGEKRIGFDYDVDLGAIAGNLFTLGLPPDVFEHKQGPVHPEVGLFEAEIYDPGAWKQNYLNDHIEACNPADAFWAGTVMARLSREHVRAAITAARFEDPRAAEVLEEVLWQRWEKTVDWALRQVTPVWTFGVDAGGDGVKASSLLDPGRIEGWRVELLDAEGHALRPAREQDDPAVVWDSLLLADRDTFVLRWTATDADGRRLRPTEAHYGRSGEGWKLLGILRDQQ